MSPSHLSYLEDRAGALLRGGYRMDEILSILITEVANLKDINEFDLEDVPFHVERIAGGNHDQLNERGL